MNTTITQNMIFPLESENQFQEAVKMAPIQAESQTLTNESTASNVETASSLLKKRKATTQTAQIDTSAPTASLMDIVSDPKLAYSSTKTRKIRKTEADSEAPTTAVTSTGAKKLIMKDGKIEFEETVAAQATRVQESEGPKRVTSASFRPSKNAEKWTDEETDKFYEGLEIFGSDFSMVGILFPKRTRDQIKKKFTREEKSNGKRVNEALKLNVSKRSIPGKLMETLNISTSTAFQTGQTAAVDEISKVLSQIVKGNL